MSARNLKLPPTQSACAAVIAFGCQMSKRNERMSPLRIIARMALLSWALWFTHASAQSPSSIGGGGGGGGTVSYNTTYYEQDKLLRSGEVIEALGPTLMGDHVNEYNGTLEFQQTDVSLPGNNALPVSVGRRAVTGSRELALAGGLFGDWDLDIPHLHTLGPAHVLNQGDWSGLAADGVTYTSQRCSQIQVPKNISVTAPSGGGTTLYNWIQWWDGYHLYAPGSGDQTLLARYPYTGYVPGSSSAYIYETKQPDGGPYPVLTKEHWNLSCLSALASGGTGEGFLARAPDGTSYQFDRMVFRDYPAFAVPTGDGTSAGAPRSEYWILPSQVTDRFGNWVRYSYDTSDGWKVLTITSSDGRSLSFTYVSGTHRVQTVTDGTRTWTYGYSGTGTLQSVTLPDSSSWQFAIQSLETRPFFAKRDPSCFPSEINTVDANTYTGTITHPSGAVGTFTLHDTWHGRSNVDPQISGCLISTANYLSTYFATYALTSKTLTGPGMPSMTWNYSYSPASGSHSPCNGCVSTKTVTVTDPQGNVTIDTYGTQFLVNEGLLLSSAVGPSGASALRTTSISYASPSGGPYVSNIGYHASIDDWSSDLYLPENQRVVSQQGVTFTKNVSDFDTFARPVMLTRSNTIGYAKTETFLYYDQYSLWVLGQLSNHEIGGIETETVDFNTTTATPSATYAFNKLTNKFFFNTDGTLSSVQDGLGNSTSFSSYKRGLPQTIGYADGTSVHAVVNNIGLITSATNEANTTWTYGYDSMGRLSSATAPTGDAVSYNTRNFTFVQVGSSEYGIAAGHWRQTITEGTATTINYFDARWRKRLTVTYDTNDVGDTERFQRFDFDPYNRTTFASYPLRTVGSVTDSLNGTRTTYDALGRVTGTSADSELGALTTTTQYLSGFQTRFTDARGFLTTNGYQAYDDPDDVSLVSSALPEGVNLSIARNVFRQATSITRSGTYNGTAVSATRSYVYDLNHLLCKTIDPETGATIQQLDAANNVSWRVSGQSFTNPSTCNQTDVAPTISGVNFAYDARNRVTGTTYGDGSPSVGKTYTADGLLHTTTSNGSTWTYGYNNRRLMTSESLNYNGTVLAIGRAYDANGHVSGLTYPNGAIASYSPNALGEPTQVSGSASNVTYQPDGTIAGFTYANGIIHTRTENTRALPLANIDAGILNDQYTYNPNGRVTGITDVLAGTTTRSMDYDGLNRLILANACGVWGSGSYTYDPLDNVRTSVLGGRSSTHNYDASNRLLSIVNSSGTTSYGYDSQGNVNSRGSLVYAFDLGNRMEFGNGENATYDGNFRRVGVTRPDGSSQIWFYDLAGEMLYQLANSGSTVVGTRYIYLGGHVISEVTSTTGPSYIHTDALGSPVKRTDASGALISSTAYEPFGRTASGVVPTDDLGFTGHVNAPELGLAYAQARFYDPLAGRFVSVDPVVTNQATGDSFNHYAYVENDPFDHVDPTGACTGSHLQDSLGLCASTGGFTTDTGGVSQAVSIASAVKEAFSKLLPAAKTPTVPQPGTPLARIRQAAGDAIEKVDEIGGQLLARWLRGILIHQLFDIYVDALGPDYAAEVSYKDHEPVAWGTLGSSRADAIHGPETAPTIAVELKTGGAYLTRGQAQRYKANLPVNTVLYEIREGE